MVEQVAAEAVADARAPCRGRRLDSSRDRAILDATLELLAADGYDRLTIEAVALRARAGKATVYRRWSSKAELVVDAVLSLHDDTPPPRTGSLRGDLEALAGRDLRVRNPLKDAVMVGLVSAMGAHPELSRAFQDHFVCPRRNCLDEILAEAVERGEVPADRDTSIVGDVVQALMFHRILIVREPPDEPYFRRVIDEVILPLATRPDTA